MKSYEYIERRTVEAEPMKKDEFYQFFGWDPKEDIRPGEEGYLVEYPDGCLGWMPKERFEDTFRECGEGACPEPAVRGNGTD